MIGEGVFASRHAGAMLLHAFFARADAGAVLASGVRRPRRDVAMLSAVSMCFALGAATIEQFKHLAAADAGLLAGLAVLPGLRTLRPRLAAIADGTDPVAVQRLFASAMLGVPRRCRWPRRRGFASLTVLLLCDSGDAGCRGWWTASPWLCR